MDNTWNPSINILETEVLKKISEKYKPEPSKIKISTDKVKDYIRSKWLLVIIILLVLTFLIYRYASTKKKKNDKSKRNNQIKDEKFVLE